MRKIFFSEYQYRIATLYLSKNVVSNLAVVPNQLYRYIHTAAAAAASCVHVEVAHL